MARKLHQNCTTFAPQFGCSERGSL